ncbi:MAG: protein-export chaperone SecB [Planctomycetia bacterium]|nr:protein-export chaperone SecB [Planctomycetia bacterium]
MATKQKSATKKHGNQRDRRDVAALATRVQLGAMHMERCLAIRSPQVPKLSEKVQVQINIEAAVEENPEGKRRLSYLLTLGLRLVGTESNQPAVFIEAAFRALYQVKEGDKGKLPQSIVTAFGRVACLPMIWPYWREFAQSMSARMGVQPITLNAFDAGKMGAWQDEKLSRLVKKKN